MLQALVKASTRGLGLNLKRKLKRADEQKAGGKAKIGKRHLP
jgi:hypothetical protein